MEGDVVEVIDGAVLEILIRRGAASVEGTVESDGEPAPNATIVLVRAGTSQSWQATSDPSGHFAIQGVAPGGYLVCAFDQIDAGAWFEPDFVTRYERRGGRIKLEENGNESKKLTLIRSTNR